MHCICIIGSQGLVGSQIYNSLKDNKKLKVYPVSRNNIDEFKDFKCDILINSNGSGNKGFCNVNPIESFKINCLSTYNYMNHFVPKRYILISTVDLYNSTSDLNKTKETVKIDASKLQVYGFHKFITENIIKQFYNDFLILRLPGLISSSLKKNSIFDIAHERNLFISKQSKLNFISTIEIANFINRFLFESPYDLVNLVASSSLSINDVIKIAGKQDFYKSFQNSNLPLQDYNISSELINTFYEVKPSEYYVSQYFNSKLI